MTLKIALAIVPMLAAPMFSAAQAGSIDYDYDDLGRLERATYTDDGSIIEYSYDENGNRTEVLIQRPGETAVVPELETDESISTNWRLIITPNGNGGYTILRLGG